MRNKRQLTEELVALLPVAQRISVDSAIPSWWYNIRRTGGMRLTEQGYRVFTEQLDLEHYSYPVEDPLLFTQQTILKLDRKMQMPYFIENKKGIPKRIVFFGSREAVMVALYGNLICYLNSV